MLKGLEYINTIKDTLEEIAFHNNEIKIDELIYDKFNVVGNELKSLEIIIKKCIYSGNLINVRIADNYNDYLSLFEDRVEKQYLLTADEFYLLKEVLSFE